MPRDPPVWCEAETGFAANITPELPAERVTSVSTDGGGPLSPLAHGWWERSGRYGGNKSGTAEVCSSPLSLNRGKGDFFTGEKTSFFLPKGLQAAARIIFAQSTKIPHLQPERNFSPRTCRGEK